MSIYKPLDISTTMQTKFPNQIDSEEVDILSALLSIENILGTNPQNDFSTLNDRLLNAEYQLKLLKPLAEKDYLKDLNLSIILSLGNSTEEYDIILGQGSVISGIGRIVNIKGNTTIDGELNIFGALDLNQHIIKNALEPIDPQDVSTKKYVDNRFSTQKNILDNTINQIITNNGSTIQYAVGVSQPFPEPEANKFLKRNIENTGWEYEFIDSIAINKRIDDVIKDLNAVSKNKSNGNDIEINEGDAIIGEGGIINIAAEVFIHGGLNIGGEFDLQGNSITNVSDPQNNKDAVNKQYLESILPQNIIITEILTEDVDNYNHKDLFNATIIRIDGGSEDRVIHGIKYPDKHYEVKMINVGKNNITLKHNSIDKASFGNRFNEEFVIKPNKIAMLFWDQYDSFWRILY